MSTTESINKIVLEFCNDLSAVYPEYKDKIENLSGKIDQNQKTKYYLEYYVRHVYPYMSSIARCDSEKCSEDNFSIMHGIKFQNIWKESVTLSTKHAIWRYLHTFYLLIQRHPKIGLVLEKYKEHEEYARMKEVFDKSDEYVNAEEILKEQANNASNGENGGNPFINPNMDEKDFENKFLNSGIGNLAKEISEEINPADLEGLNNPEDLFSSLLGGKGGNAGIGNLIQKVGSKLQNKLQSGELNEQSLINEAQNMMGMLNPDMKNMMGMGSMFNAFSGMGGGGKKKKKNSRRSKNRK
jgi:hypothetical protein